MSQLIWEESFQTGNNDIDTQHKIFINIIKKVITAKEKGKDKKLLETLLAELIKFTEFHFISEENIMRENTYPQFNEHRKEHEKVLADLRNRIFSLQYEYIDFQNLEIYLKEWFSQHTIHHDAQLAKFIQKNKN